MFYSFSNNIWFFIFPDYSIAPIVDNEKFLETHEMHKSNEENESFSEEEVAKTIEPFIHQLSEVPGKIKK